MAARTGWSASSPTATCALPPTSISRSSELMTKDKLVTVKRSVDREEAKRLLHQHRIEKLLVVDDDYQCIGLITVKDIEKAQKHPNACKDSEGRLRVAAATTVGEDGHERTERLIAAGCDLIVVDTAHGHSKRVLDAVNRIKKLSNARAGDRRQRRHGRGHPGADRCRRRRGQGRHRPGLDLHHPHRRRRRRAAADRHHRLRRSRQQTRRSHHRRRRHQVLRRPRQGDGGRRLRRDGRLAAGRHRRGAGRDLSLPGPHLQGLSRHGLGRRHGARLGRPLLPAGGAGHPEAGAGRHRGPGALQGPGRRRAAPAGRRPARQHGLSRRARRSPSSRQRAKFVRISPAAMRESHTHGVTITRESPNYPGGMSLAPLCVWPKTSSSSPSSPRSC